jgi:hypothetical protein
VADTTYLHIFWRGFGEADFVHTKIEISMDECNDYEAMPTNDLMAVAVRHEFSTEGGAYYLEEPDPENTADTMIEENLVNGYDLIAAFFGDVHFIN